MDTPMTVAQLMALLPDRPEMIVLIREPRGGTFQIAHIEIDQRDRLFPVAVLVAVNHIPR